MSEGVALFAAGMVLASIVAYYTAQAAVASRLVRLETSLEASIDNLTNAITAAKNDLSNEVRQVRDELRTYYQRRP
jgi:hypothetical protein